MSLLTIIQDASIECSLLKPSTAFANTDPAIVRLVRLSEKVGQRLMKVFDWQVLTKEKTYTSVATEEQTSFFEADFDRFIPETMWNRTDQYLIAGPVTAREWQDLKATNYSDTANRKLRYRGGSALITPTMPAGKTIAYEYVSNQWCQSSGGSGQTAWAVDTDTGVIDEELLTLGTIWEYLANEGLPNNTQAEAYESRFNTLIENDRPGDDILISGDIFGGYRHYSGAPGVAGSGGLFQ